MIRFRFVCLAAWAAGACNQEPASEAEVVAETNNSGKVFHLEKEEIAQLASQADRGDSEAAFRIANYYNFSGSNGVRANVKKSQAEAEKWLIIAAENGHETAKFNLAVRMGSKDCEAAQTILRGLVETTSDENLRSGAISWLSEGSGLCGPD